MRSFFLDWHIYALNNVYMLHLGKSWQQLQVYFTKKKKGKYLQLEGKKGKTNAKVT